MNTNFQSQTESFRSEIESVSTQEELESLRIRILGRKGVVKGWMANLKSLSAEERSACGKTINDSKMLLSEILEAKKAFLIERENRRRMEEEWIDVTLPRALPNLGSLHPVSLVQYDLEDVFTAMGFQVLDGPHVETEHYNFTALNIPDNHPARDLQDTFYFENGQLLRTQTSTIQIRGMERLGQLLPDSPLRIVGPGKVFRAERVDASHECVFHQLEGMVVDKDISVAHLIHFMQVVIDVIFEPGTKFRLRPGYFPFVEPGFELDIQCQICGGGGCRVCKRIGWIELLGCGMVHPEVLENGGIDPEEYTGFAFGIGVDRLAMNKYGIDDIRNLHHGDVEFARQFSKVR